MSNDNKPNRVYKSILCFDEQINFFRKIEISVEIVIPGLMWV